MGKRKYPPGFTDLYDAEYATWKGIRQRCNNPNNEWFQYYGGKGVKVCKRWDRFDLFVEDMGRKPGSEWSIERINSGDDYRPENCYWTRIIDQNSNKTNTLPLIERIHPQLQPVFRRTIEIAVLPEDATWEDIADGWLPSLSERPLY